MIGLMGREPRASPNVDGRSSAAFAVAVSTITSPFAGIALRFRPVGQRAPPGATQCVPAAGRSAWSACPSSFC